MFACQVEGFGEMGTAKPQAAMRWVRTVDGWERPDRWNLDSVRRPTLHPLVVAAGMGLFSVLGLLAFEREER